MKHDIHRHLDGEITADALEPRDREVVDEWDRMLDAFRTAEPSNAVAPPWLEQRVMAEIEAMPEQGVVRRVLAWLIRPAPLQVPPLAAGLVVAAFAAVIAWPGNTPLDEPTEPDR